MRNSRESDSQCRERALDASQSFIVQAPAGSGKTELLTQRFLVLLNHVNSPEEILAITFTKKSAHEMRARIINTLKNAADTIKEPELAHAKKTWQLAKKVLQRDAKFEWNLLANPNRLRIQTIDAFNASLTKRMPILAEFGASPEISDQSEFLYIEAVQEFLSHLEEDVTWSNAIAQLLLHMDNDLNKVQKLLINMLKKREQWQHIIALNTDDPVLRNQLEGYLKNIIREKLTEANNAFPKHLIAELISAIQFAANNLREENSSSKVITCAELTSLPNNQVSDLSLWLGITDFLLTSSNTWRKKLTVKEGFPAHEKEIKTRASALLGELSNEDKLCNILREIRQLPTQKYAEIQWEILQALHLVLRVVTAQLRLTFQKYGKIDYIGNAQAAQVALGDIDAPTDLALALDYRIQHILVDEFQDTANIQYHLLEKLTAGWQPNDGRTLFVVGDPMQSIYRFREAEVGLFIRARQHGLGHVKLEPLTLAVNFRSTAEIVNWVNKHFKKVLPPYEDIATGAVSYSESIANQTENSNEKSHITLHPFIDSDAFSDQANKIIELIHQARKTKPDGSIAILVRTRTHLKSIIPALKAANLAFRAINIDPLSLRPTIQDLMALTRALLHPADRIAWLSVLRAPWCGLTLSDLLILSGSHANIPLWRQLQANDVIDTLSEDGQSRLRRILPLLKEKIHERRRFTLRLWIESTWILLGGPACVEQSSDLYDAAAYFALLEKLDNGGDLSNLDALNETIQQLYAAPDNQADESLQIMTIHNAKGLEFDTVILPHLERKPSYDDPQLLLWMERQREDDKTDLLIAPTHAIGEDKDAIYEYIKSQIKAKASYETGRLLYVAVTRAKRNLHLLFSLESKKSDPNDFTPPANSLLDTLWPAIHDDIHSAQLNAITPNKNIASIIENKNATKRLKSDWVNPVQQYTIPPTVTYHQKSTGFLLSDNQYKIIGTLMHAILQQLSQFGASWWTNATSQQQTHYIKRQLLQLGLLDNDLPRAINLITKGITNLFQDERAQWILKLRTESASELPITAVIDGEVKAFYIDRTFIDENGIRWIIDYKTTILTEEDLDTFLITEQKKYKNQLWDYHQALRHSDPRPIRVGLYFPMIPAWKEWSFEG